MHDRPNYQGVTCAYLPCDRPVKAHGLCETHYRQLQRGAPLTPIAVKSYDGQDCGVPDCARRPMANGLCLRHYRASRRAVTDAIKLERSCADCGYRDDARALEFHHIDPAGKDERVGAMVGWNLERVLAEVDKCIVLCANCHRVRHATRSLAGGRDH